MRFTVLLFALTSALTLAADNAVMAPRTATGFKPQAASYKPQATTLGTEAIAIPHMLSFQGKLTDTLGQPVPNGNYSVAFKLYTVPSGGSAFWNETQNVATKAGLFGVLLGAVTPIGALPDAGTLYLAMKVGADPEMMPRVRIVSAAYAFKADTAAYALAGGGASDNAWVRGEDSVLYTVHYLGLARGGAGNVLLGSQRQTHVNFGARCTTGSAFNDSFCTVGGGARNVAMANYATVCGGAGDSASAFAAAVGGGWTNAAGGAYATVGGGAFNAVSGGLAGTVGGGYGNSVRNDYTTVGGGSENQANGSCATVAGGNYNDASGDYYATVGGGNRNAASGRGATVGGGDGDTAISSYGGVFSGKHNIAGNTADDSFAVVSGGYFNRAAAYGSTVGGGVSNCAANANCSTVAGGDSNLASGLAANVAGGSNNTASAQFAAVCGGTENVASGRWSVVAGGGSDTTYGDYDFAVGNHSIVPVSYVNSASFNGQTATASNQLRCGTLSKAGGSFTIDDPIDPQNKILNHYFVESPDMSNLYSGSVVLDAIGRGEVRLPDYFDALNRNPRVQLTGVGSSDVVYVTEDISGNRFVVGGRPGMKVYWQVTGDRKDPSAEVIRAMMPVEQPKTGALAGRMLDDDFLAGCIDQLVREGKAAGIDFRTAAGRARYERMKQLMEHR
jgi:hypothetical protein